MAKVERSTATATVAALLVACCTSALAQTPEQQKAWDEERAKAAVVEKAKAEELARQRAARKADPMGWVRTLDPMSSGGWEFRSVGTDGSWAVFSTTHQMKREGQIVTVWMRHEYAEPQMGDDGAYLSAVQKEQYDCKKQQTRNLLVIFYAANNIQGSQQTEESEAKTTPWNSIVPGTREETNFSWACNQARAAGAR